METIKSLKTFKPALAGMPDLSVVRLAPPETVAVSAMDIPYIRPKLLVRENDPVKTGTPVFCDKRKPAVQYLSPGTGHVRRIVFGERRRLKEVVIALDSPGPEGNDARDRFIEFERLPGDLVDTTPLSKIVDLLQKGGLWQCFREFPFRDTADETRVPPMIIVSLNGNDPFSPHPGVVLENDLSLFEYGIQLLRRFSRRIVVTSRTNSMKGLGKLAPHVTHTVSDIYPAWDPGAVLYRLKQSKEENCSWCISAEHLVLLARLLLTGRYPVKRVVTVTRANDRKPHILACQGAPVKDLAGRLEDGDLVATGRFNGRSVDPGSHMGFFENTLNIIHAGQEEELFGFIRPGLTKPTASKTFLSCLIPGPKEFDCNLHGEERACINCSYCTHICPNDLAPSFIMKALASDDIEDALSYGLLDCCGCGLCSYACPSKIELTKILSQGMDAHYKDKE
jgi:Na+-transporting NADH:ubiquinone oxidoreductase subunit A